MGKGGTLLYQRREASTFIFGEELTPASSYTRIMQREMNQKTRQNYYLTAVLEIVSSGKSITML